jgi:hypothetical protein
MVFLAYHSTTTAGPNMFDAYYTYTITASEVGVFVYLATSSVTNRMRLSVTLYGLKGSMTSVNGPSHLRLTEHPT